MKKISTLAIALIAMGSLATPVSAQNIMPKASTEGGATYTYYLQGAGKQNNAPVYDLTGRRVVRTVKGGLYIKGGNKFIAR